MEWWEEQQAAQDRALQQLRDFACELMGDSATVTVSLPDVFQHLEIRPRNPRAARVSVLASGELVVQIGRGEGGRWEFELDEVATIQRLIAAVYAGRVVERISLMWSQVTVTLEDGDVWRETGLGCLSLLLPLPLWKRVHYEPYE